MKKQLQFLLYIVVITFILLEIVFRVITVEKKPGYEYLFDKAWYYLLPFQPEFTESDTTSVGKYRIYDPSLGWDIGRSGADEPLYYSDSRGLRCTKEQFESKQFVSQDSFDIICIGDSFTHGDAVLQEESWPYLLQQRSGKTVLNLGVGGFGIDQAILKYEKRPFHGETVLLGLITGDLERAMSTVYNFYVGGKKTKPRFQFNEDGTTQIINQPCAVNEALEKQFSNFEESEVFDGVNGFEPVVFKKSFLDISYTWRIVKSVLHQRKNKKEPIYRTDDERLEYCIQVLEHLKKLCEERNSNLKIVLLDNRNTFNDRKKMDQPWKLFIQKLEAAGIEFLNPGKILYKAYSENQANVIHPEEGVHYSKAGNELVADFLAGALRD